jgi:hypothetical protein
MESRNDCERMKADMATGRAIVYKLILAPPLFIAGMAATYVALGAKVTLNNKEHPDQSKVLQEGGGINIAYIGIAALLFWGGVMVWNKK